MRISTLFFLAGVQVALGLPAANVINADVDKRDARLAGRDAAPFSDVVRRASEIKLDDRDLEERAANKTTDTTDKKDTKKKKGKGAKKNKKKTATTPGAGDAAAAAATPVNATIA